MNFNFAGYAYSRNWGIGTALRQDGSVQCLPWRFTNPAVPAFPSFSLMEGSLLLAFGIGWLRNQTVVKSHL
jgi:hypothetical protein